MRILAAQIHLELKYPVVIQVETVYLRKIKEATPMGGFLDE
jgi:hypothetical protein